MNDVFDKHITLGNVLTILVMIATVLYFVFRVEAKADKALHLADQNRKNFEDHCKFQQENIDAFWKVQWPDNVKSIERILTKLESMESDIKELKGK